MQAVREERSIGQLLKELRDETTTLLRQEVDLAKTEMGEKAADYGKNAASIATGGAVAYAGALLLLAGVTVALALVLHRIGLGVHGWWVAPLVVVRPRHVDELARIAGTRSRHARGARPGRKPLRQVPG